jgi:hypothetical protein
MSKPVLTDSQFETVIANATRAAAYEYEQIVGQKMPNDMRHRLEDAINDFLDENTEAA